MTQKLKDSQIQYLKVLYDGIKQRCYNPKNPAYKNYGGRGISFSLEWKNNRKKFVIEILSNLGHRISEEHQLDRIDVNGNYELGNLRWVTSAENNKNKRNNNLIKIGTKIKTITEWSKESRINQATILWRIKNNWTDDKLLSSTKNKKEFSSLRIRSIYEGIKNRCYNLTCPIYKYYGERGIIMSHDWINDYKKFKKDITNSIGLRPSSIHQLDRINVNGNYELNNLRWATPKENCRNKRNNKLIKINDEIKTLTEWSEISGVNRSTITKRLKLGYSDKDLLIPNIQKRFSKDQIEEIKKLSNKMSMRELAKQFNCGHTTILDILHERGAYKITGEK